MTLLAIFSDHSSLVSTRRALLVSSFTTITLSLLEVKGEGITVLGLTFVAQSEGLIAVSKFALLYIIFVYSGYVTTPILNYFENRRLLKNLSLERRRKHEADDEYFDIVGYPDEHNVVIGREDLRNRREESRQKAEKARNTSDEIVRKQHAAVNAVMNYLLNIFLALAIAVFALVAPIQALRALFLP